MNTCLIDGNCYDPGEVNPGDVWSTFGQRETAAVKYYAVCTSRLQASGEQPKRPYDGANSATPLRYDLRALAVH